eukprot:Pgem_evm1s17712
MYFTTNFVLTFLSMHMVQAWPESNTEKCRNNQRVQVNTEQGWQELPLENKMYSFTSKTIPGGWGWGAKPSKIEWKCGDSYEKHSTDARENSKVSVYVMYNGNDVKFIVSDYKEQNEQTWLQDLKRGQRPVSCCKGVDFSNQDLSGLDLSLLDFENANLSGTNLTDCNLKDANMNSANLTGAIFSNQVEESVKQIMTQLVTGNFTMEELHEYREKAKESKVRSERFEALLDIAEMKKTDYKSFEQQLITIANNTEEQNLLNPVAKKYALVLDCTVGTVTRALTEEYGEGFITGFRVSGGISMAITAISAIYQTGTVGVLFTMVQGAAVSAFTTLAAAIGSMAATVVVIAAVVAVAGIGIGYVLGGIFGNWGDNSIDRCRNNQKFEINVAGHWTEVVERNEMVTYRTPTEGDKAKIWWKCGGVTESTDTKYVNQEIAVNVLYDGQKINWIFSK